MLSGSFEFGSELNSQNVILEEQALAIKFSHEIEVETYDTLVQFYDDDQQCFSLAKSKEKEMSFAWPDLVPYGT